MQWDKMGLHRDRPFDIFNGVLIFVFIDQLARIEKKCDELHIVV